MSCDNSKIICDLKLFKDTLGNFIQESDLTESNLSYNAQYFDELPCFSRIIQIYNNPSGDVQDEIVAREFWQIATQLQHLEMARFKHEQHAKNNYPNFPYSSQLIAVHDTIAQNKSLINLLYIMKFLECIHDHYKLPSSRQLENFKNVPMNWSVDAFLTKRFPDGTELNEFKLALEHVYNDLQKGHLSSAEEFLEYHQLVYI